MVLVIVGLRKPGKEDEKMQHNVYWNIALLVANQKGFIVLPEYS